MGRAALLVVHSHVLVMGSVQCLAAPRSGAAAEACRATRAAVPQGETEAIGKLLEKTQLQKYGPGELSQRFMIMDTICDATQARGVGGRAAGVSGGGGSCSRAAAASLQLRQAALGRCCGRQRAVLAALCREPGWMLSLVSWRHPRPPQPARTQPGLAAGLA